MSTMFPNSNYQLVLEFIIISTSELVIKPFLTPFLKLLLKLIVQICLKRFLAHFLKVCGKLRRSLFTKFFLGIFPTIFLNSFVFTPCSEERRRRVWNLLQRYQFKSYTSHFTESLTGWRNMMYRESFGFLDVKGTEGSAEGLVVVDNSGS